MQTILIPPIKCQGIKTKLIPFLKEYIIPPKDGLWIEPFVGTGVVAFNLAPRRALLTDKNQYIISFYQKIQTGAIDSGMVREFLEYHGNLLAREGESYYLQMRSQFNQNGDPLYFLFLNRADFNGMIRFNRQGEFNVPFCKKPNRFSKAYITKICNQVSGVSDVMRDKDWRFICAPWQAAFAHAGDSDLLYLDPPYIGRDTSYVGEWNEADADDLAQAAHRTSASVCLSMWKENQFRKNAHLYRAWSDFTWYEYSHFYHVGARESNRHPMIEVLAVKR